MQDDLITIITPTYNRAYCINKLYESLVNQTNKSFNWLIVDDGSSDSTELVVNNYINENKLKIKYIKKANGGKHTALNVGIKQVQTKYTFIVDSDDWLTENAIERVVQYDKKYRNEPIAGFSFLRMYPDGKYNITSGRKDDFVASYNRVRIYENRIGDMAEVYLTEVLKAYPFPEFENEKFLSEDIVWVEIGKKYDLVFINDSIYVSDYLTDGLTINRRKNNIRSARGAFERSKVLLSVRMKFLLKVKNILQLIIYGKFCKKKFKEIKKAASNTFLLCILYLPGEIMYNLWRKI